MGEAGVVEGRRGEEEEEEEEEERQQQQQQQELHVRGEDGFAIGASRGEEKDGGGRVRQRHT